MKSEEWSPLIAFVKHLSSLDFIKNGRAWKTFSNLMVVLEIDSYMPSEIGTAVSELQDASDKREDSGLAAIIVGLSQGKSLLKQARVHAEEMGKNTEFLADLGTYTDKASSMELPPKGPWTDCMEVVISGSEKIVDAAANQKSESVRGIITHSKKIISEYAISLCKAFVNHAALPWITKVRDDWTVKNDPPVNPLSGVSCKGGKFNVLSQQAQEALQLTRDMDSIMEVIYNTKKNALAKTLDTNVSVNVAKEVESFMLKSGTRMWKLHFMDDSQWKVLKNVYDNILALSDSRITRTAAVHIKSLGDLMIKAC